MSCISPYARCSLAGLVHPVIPGIDVIVADCEPCSGLCVIGLPLPQLIFVRREELSLGFRWILSAMLRFGVALDGYLALLLAEKASA